MRPAVAFALVTFALALPACAGPLSTGVALYDEGRYPDALAALRAARAPEQAAERARWALYRGLAHLAVGDVEASRAWLADARAAWLADPRVLAREDAARLAAAWAHLPE